MITAAAASSGDGANPTRGEDDHDASLRAAEEGASRPGEPSPSPLVATSSSPSSSSASLSSDGAGSAASGEGSRSTSNKTKKAGKKGDRQVPLVRLELDGVTYSPAMSPAAKKARGKPATGGKGGGPAGAGAVSRTKVLDKVSTAVEPYQLSAWMGPSGSGKTSLLSVAAGLVRPADVTEGAVLVNGEKGRIPKRLVGVVWQDDLLLSNLTVFENVYYCARLKTCEDVPDADVVEIVRGTLREVGLWHVRDSLVGAPLSALDKRGISGGERKRVAVACELVLRPSLLLLDEPTSGLDATTARALVRSLQQLARRGRSVAVVIHQPRTAIYGMFDRLLLLSRGRAVYDGSPSKARAFLESCPGVSPLPAETGIADWMMDVVIEDEARAGSEGGPAIGALARHWEDCRARSAGERSASGGVCCESSDARDDPAGRGRPALLERRMSTLGELNSGPKFFVGFRRQLSLLTVRTLKQQRGERLTATASLLQLAYLFFTALFWWRMPDDASWVFSRNSLLFFMLIAQANGIVISAVTVFQRERALLSRERAKKMYGVGSFFVSKSVSDMTANVLLPLLYGMVVYWTANLRPSAAAYLQFILAFYLALSTAQSMGLFLSIAIRQTQLSLILAPPITLFFMILGGFYIPFPNLNPGVAWLSWVSFARYAYSALVVNEFAGRSVPCAAGAAAAAGAACPLPGDDVLRRLGIEGLTASFWFNIGMTAALQVFFRVAAYGMLRRSR
jgi:ABC-type multidrug transport system ATPase subunit/ABC-type multidrug transport system permease subunit